MIELSSSSIYFRQYQLKRRSESVFLVGAAGENLRLPHNYNEGATLHDRTPD